MAELIEAPKKLAEDHYILKIRGDMPPSLPGQFINIKTNSGYDPLIRRPFSVYNHEGDTMEIVIRVVGKGTELLKSHKPGPIDIIGPVGKGFLIKKKTKALLVGGGVGNAPLYLLARELKANGGDITFVYGARNKDFIYCEDEFKSLSDNFILMTDDGSAGKKGFVTEAVASLLKSNSFDMIYTCGPEKMMEKLVEIAGKTHIEVSMENYFGCGVGLCSGCTVETDRGLLRACVDGPVFDGKSIKWETLG